MNILVIGGSYFLGRHFVNIAHKENNVFVFNRGNCPINISEVTEIRGDRHNEKDLSKLAEYNIDVVVDFCAYNQGDILQISKVLGKSLLQYIFISTVDVYMHGTGETISEDGPFETRSFAGPEGEYISGKVALEKEIREMADSYGFKYTVFRPTFIYGPGNYAPREGIYFNWISQAGQILHPVDATGEFQFVYVLDVAKAIYESLGNEEAYDEAYNLTGETIDSYDSFADALSKAVNSPFEKVGISVMDVYEKQIPLPFPLTKEESNLYTGKKVLELIGKYTSLEEGLSNI